MDQILGLEFVDRFIMTLFVCLNICLETKRFVTETFFDDFFKADEFPNITFVSTSVKRDGDDITIVGELTLRGVSKSVTLAGEFGGIVIDGYGQSKAGFSASTKINRHDFGVSWNAALEAGGFTLGDDVTINFELQFTLQAA